MTECTKLNNGWDAEPNAPDPAITVHGSRLVLTFFLNFHVDTSIRMFDRGELTFHDCWRYRLGATNDEGWYKKQCRFRLVAPEWGMFYEVRGDLRLEDAPADWILTGSASVQSRHFVFYFRDETFECDARDWSFRVLRISEAESERLQAECRTVTLTKPSLADLVIGLISAPFWAVRRLLRHFKGKQLP